MRFLRYLDFNALVDIRRDAATRSSLQGQARIMLVELARVRPADDAALESLESWTSHRGRASARALLAAVSDARRADPMELPAADIGDLVAVLQSGAYGLSASPTAFLGHPPPLEVLV